jgi:spore germination protein KA
MTQDESSVGRKKENIENRRSEHDSISSDLRFLPEHMNGGRSSNTISVNEKVHVKAGNPMFSFLLKKARILLTKKEQKNGGENYSYEETPIFHTLSDNIKAIREETGNSSDIVYRSCAVGCGRGVKAVVIFIEGLADKALINNHVIKPILSKAYEETDQNDKRESLISYIQNAVLSVSDAAQIGNLDEVIGGILSGSAVMLVDGEESGLIVNTKGFEKRSVSEPPSEAVVRGPRECFVEDIATNTSLVRRKIRNQALTVESMRIGDRTRTKVSVVYINGIANPELIDLIKKRLRAISTDSILESGYIEQFIEDSPGSVFSTTGYTEKPDVAAAKILEGRAAILVDGTPFVLTAPLLFGEYFQTAEDYYFRPYYATLLRVVRILAAVITVLAPALYVAVATYHQELFPTGLLFTMAKAREGIPFPVFVECMIMVVTFEILREAGIRLPRPVGQALSIVGALVIGEAAVSAGLIGAPMVIVVAITAVSGFAVPNLADSAAVIRLIYLILAAVFGGFGITIGILGTLVHMAALESYGVPFLSPVAPFDLEDSKDAVLRVPLWMMGRRPKAIGAQNKKRRDTLVPPPNQQENSEE